MVKYFNRQACEEQLLICKQILIKTIQRRTGRLARASSLKLWSSKRPSIFIAPVAVKKP